MKRTFAALACIAACSASIVSAQSTGTVRGRVVTENGAAIESARVMVVGSPRGAVTDRDGNFALDEIAPGRVRLRATKIGLKPERRTTVVRAGSESRVEFVMREDYIALSDDPSVIRMSMQPLRSGARVDSVIPDAAARAAASTIPELLAGRVPGLQVTAGSGAVSAGSRLRLRGASSVLLRNDPLVVVNGVRIVSEPREILRGVGGQGFSRLDDFLLEGVERVEVLHGPAGAAKYGQAGAHGVIEVWTHRPTAGEPRVRAFAEAGARQLHADFPANFGFAGVTPAGVPVADCSPLEQALGRCRATGELRLFNPLEQASPFRSGAVRRAGASVASGAGAVMWEAGAAAERDMGVLERDARERANLSGSFALRPIHGVELTGTVLHLRNELDLPSGDGSPYASIRAGLLGSTADDPVTRGYSQDPRQSLDSVWTTQRLIRTVGSAEARVSPFGWWTVGGRFGIDDAGAAESPHARRQEDERAVKSRTIKTEHVRRNAEAYARLDYGVGSSLRLASTLGAERVSARDRTRDLTTYVRSFFPGASGTESAFRLATTGVYARQEAAWRGRVSAALAVRRDDGEFTHSRLSASVSAAWELGRERFFPAPGWMNGLRLRGAFGRVEAESVSHPALFDGCSFCGYAASDDPETHQEAEVGLDAAFLGERVGVSVTAYDHDTHHALVAIPSYSSGGGGATIVNTDRVTNRGVEARARVGSGPAAALSWEVEAIGSVNRNRFWSEREQGAFLDAGSQVAVNGRPVGAFIGERVTGYQDRDGDGRITGFAPCAGECEVTLSPYGEYLGAPDPSRMLALAGRVGAWRVVRLSARVDHQGGMRKENLTRIVRCQNGLCGDLYDPAATLAEQVEVAALVLGAPLVEDASFTRLREVALTLAAPARWTRAFGGSLEVTVAGRNLATWTGYSGLDPETNASGAGAFANRDFFTQPLPRTLTTRVDVRF